MMYQIKPNDTIITYPRAFHPLAKNDARRKIAKGGRGSGKSRSFAKLAIRKAKKGKVRVLCCRELQGSIKDSVHKLLVDTIAELKWNRFFKITDTSIKSATGSEFIFKGLRSNYNEIKSLEGIDICWIEEAEGISQESIEYLLPTIRKPGAEVWVSFNPETKESPCNQTFVEHPEPGSIIVEMNWRENEWFPDELRVQKDWCKKTDPEKHDWVWEGKFKKYAQDLIFRDKIEVDQEFETHQGVIFYFGLDFGFADDPLAGVRAYVHDHNIYIDYEIYGRGIELDQIHEKLLDIPGSTRWKIRADSSRPDTISYVKRPLVKGSKTYAGYDIVGAEKGEGSVEDGIDFLKSFKKIFIHKRCKGAKEDFQNYRWKRHPKTQEILPVPLDKANHIPDALRYAMEPLIKAKVSGFDVV